MQLFENIASLKTIGDRVRERRVTSESSLVSSSRTIASRTLSALSCPNSKDFPSTESGLNLSDGVYFATTASNLRDETDGRHATKRDEKLRTDQICVFRNAGSKNEIAYVVEHKAPHKLHTTHFEQGLRKRSIFDEVVNRLTIPMAEPEKFHYYAERLSAGAGVEGQGEEAPWGVPARAIALRTALTRGQQHELKAQAHVRPPPQRMAAAKAAAKAAVKAAEPDRSGAGRIAHHPACCRW